MCDDKGVNSPRRQNKPKVDAPNNTASNYIKQEPTGGARLARWVKLPTLDVSSGHDLMVREMEPRVGLCADSMDPAWDSLSPCLSAPLPLTHMCPHAPSRSLSLSK